jgi:hypothetical protein
MPLYIVTDSSNSATRLVEAANPAQALRHVTAKQFAVASASAAAVAKLMSAGIKLETTATETTTETQED